MKVNVVRLTPADWESIHDCVRRSQAPPDVKPQIRPLIIRLNVIEALQRGGINPKLPVFCWLDRHTGDDCFSHIEPPAEDVSVEFRQSVDSLLQKHIELVANL